MKKLCKAAENLIDLIQSGAAEDPILRRQKIWMMHCALYHRATSEFGQPKEICTVWNTLVDVVTWEELVAIATASK